MGKDSKYTQFHDEYRLRAEALRDAGIKPLSQSEGWAYGIPCPSRKCNELAHTLSQLANHLYLEHDGFSWERAWAIARDYFTAVRTDPKFIELIRSRQHYHQLKKVRAAMKNGKRVTPPTKNGNGTTARGTVAAIARRGVRSASDFAEFMSALMTGVVLHEVGAEDVNAACTAGRNLLKITEMQYRAEAAKHAKPLMLVGKK